MNKYQAIKGMWIKVSIQEVYVKKIKCTTFAIFLILLTSLTSYGEEVPKDFQENQLMLEKLLSEGIGQRYFKNSILSLKNIISTSSNFPNSEPGPVLFKIYERDGNSFKFDGIVKGMFVEPPICQYYEISFSGQYNEWVSPPNRTNTTFQINKNWKVGGVNLKFTDRSQCL